MNLETYQSIVKETALYPPQFGYMYTTLGLVGEFQEFVEAKSDKDKMKEFGDCCWYLAANCKEWGIHLLDVFPFDLQNNAH